MNDEYDYKKLPTASLILDANFKILKEGGSLRDVEPTRKAIAGIGASHFYLAECHYKLGENRVRQYFITPPARIRRALKIKSINGDAVIVEFLEYGQRKV